MEKRREHQGPTSQKTEGVKKENQGDVSTKWWNVPLQSLKAFCDRKYIPGDTYRYIFQKSLEMHWTYVYYRLGITLAHAVSFVISLVNLFAPCPPYARLTCITDNISFFMAWPFYLTSWGMVLNLSQSVLGLFLAVRAYRRQKSSKRQNAAPPFLQVKDEHKLWTFTGFYWSLNSVSTVLAFIISVVYWSLIFDYSETVTPKIVQSLMEHFFNLVWMTVDRCLVAFPVMIIQGVLFLPIGIFYILASLAYFAIGGLDQFDTNDYLYEFLNWHYPGMSIASIILLTIVVLLLMLPTELIDRFKHKTLRPQQIFEAYEKMMTAKV